MGPSAHCNSGTIVRGGVRTALWPLYYYTPTKRWPSLQGAMAGLPLREISTADIEPLLNVLSYVDK